MKKFIGFLVLFFCFSIQEIFGQFVSETYLSVPNRTVAAGGWTIQIPVSIYGIGAFRGFDFTIHYTNRASRVWWYEYPYTWNFPSDWLTASYSNEDTMHFAMTGSTTKLINGNMLIGLFTFHIDGLTESTRVDLSASVVFSNGAKDSVIKLDYRGGYIITGPAIPYPGSMNQDAVYDLSDVQRIIRINHQEAGIVSLVDSLTADVSGDGNVDSYDAWQDLERVVNPYWLFPVKGPYYGNGGGGNGGKGIALSTPTEIVLEQIGQDVKVMIAKNDSLIHNGDLYISAPGSVEKKSINGFSNLNRKNDKFHLSFVSSNGIEQEKVILLIRNAKAEDVKIEGMMNNNVPINLIIRKTTGVQNKFAVPLEFSLKQNYPNPFNPNTKISFDLPSNVKVMLKVYDMLGREVAMLVDGEMNAGNHEANFNASGLSSGIYIYRLTAGSFTETKRMNLLK